MSGRRKEGADGQALEYDVKESVKAILDSLPYCFYFMPAAGVFGKVGISDFIGVCNGRFFAIEAKRNAKKVPTVPQRLFLASVRRARGFAARIHSGNVTKLHQRLVDHCGLTCPF